jgi:7-keto-8-aminopelargonate synthetase-like enzyme
MSIGQRDYKSRDVRYVPIDPLALTIRVGDIVLGWVENLSARGLLIASKAQDLRAGEMLNDLSLHWHAEKINLPTATVKRVSRSAHSPGEVRLSRIACSFDDPPDDALELLRPAIQPAAYVTGELRREINGPGDSEPPPQRDLRDFADSGTSRLLDKCDNFYAYMRSLQDTGHYQSLYRATLTTPLDHRVSIYNPISHREEDFVCFDSNSYLGLHIHPQVVEATSEALAEFGYGTPSAPLLSGTNRHMRELEDTISWFHGRKDTIIFSSGYGANVGTITALVGRNDIGIADQYSHASIHDACGWANPKQLRTFPHRDNAALDGILQRILAAKPEAGRLIMSDGVFSMHGSIADLPGLRKVADKHRATLMLDEAHSTGVLGATGRGLEEHYGCEGAADVLMGTFSKAPGTVGGYVTGSEELITYLRFFANSGMFSASIPAALCAGLKVAFEIMANDPEPRERLWENINWLAPALTAAGLNVSAAESPILTVFIGDTNLLWQISRELYAKGVKCGNVCFPAVPPGEGILRISVNARHTLEDLERCVESIRLVASSYGILHKSKEEIREIGERFAKKGFLAEAG